MELGTSTLPGNSRKIPASVDRIERPRGDCSAARRMGSLAIAFALSSVLVFGSGCTGTRFWGNDADNRAQSSSSSPFSPPSRSSSNQDFIMTGASSPVVSSGTVPFFSNSSEYSKWSKVPATEMVIAWRNWIDYLPDPTQSGRKGPGLAGQMFLFGPKAVPVLADGTLTIDLFDETPRPQGQPGNIPERWTFDKEALKALQSTDERFGKCYVLFLPWPSYRPDVTRVRIATRYDMDNKRTLFAEESKLNISPTPPGPLTISNDKFSPGQGLDSLMGLSGFGPGAGTNMGMGSMSSNAGTPSAFGAGSMSLGVIGSQLNGVPAANMLPAIPPDPALPISRKPVSTVPLSAIQPPGAVPAATADNAYYPPASDNRGLTPAAGTPQGLPPFAFVATPGRQ